jgi:hypothetical protein
MPLKTESQKKNTLQLRPNPTLKVMDICQIKWSDMILHQNKYIVPKQISRDDLDIIMKAISYFSNGVVSRIFTLNLGEDACPVI